MGGPRDETLVVVSVLVVTGVIAIVGSDVVVVTGCSGLKGHVRWAWT